MTIFIELSNEAFDEVFESSEVQAQTIYGTDYGSSYEVLDKAREYAHFIFQTKQEAMKFISRKYPDCSINFQMDLFEEVGAC